MDDNRPRNILYRELEEKDVSLALKTAYEEIKNFQEILRQANPNSPLLGMISLFGPSALRNGRNFESILTEHTEVKPSDSQYVALGYYVELLKSEIKSPRFLPKVY